MTGPRPAGLILAGGKSTRFGSDKASALLLGRPLLQWAAEAVAASCVELVVVRAAGQVLPRIAVTVPVTVVDDMYEGQGPLAGLVAGFGGLAAEWYFATSCDAPLVQPELVALLARHRAGADIVVPRAGGFLQPLAALYRSSACEPVFRERVEAGHLKITAAYEGLTTVVVEEPELREADPEMLSFLNANTPERLAQISGLLRKG